MVVGVARSAAPGCVSYSTAFVDAFQTLMRILSGFALVLLKSRPLTMKRTGVASLNVPVPLKMPELPLTTRYSKALDVRSLINGDAVILKRPVGAAPPA